MIVLVTGAGGFLGESIVRAALTAQCSVVAVSRKAEPARLNDLGSSIGRAAIDMADTEGLRRVILAERPEVVIHTAWSGLAGGARASSNQLADNVVPTCRLIEAAGEAGVAKFIGIGSQAEYGLLNRRVTEADLPQPVSMYGAAKLAAYHLGSEVARQAGMSFAWLRLFATFGPGDNPNWLIPSVIEQLATGRRPKCSLGTQKWDYLYIDDAAAGVIAVARTPAANGVFNLASGEPVPVRVVIEHLRDLAAPGMDLVFGDIPFGPNAIMLMEGGIDRLRQSTGWAPHISLLEGLRRTVLAAAAPRGSDRA